MKKQLLIAAVAATMTSAAMADVSITGAAFAKYSNVDSGNAATADTNTINQEMDLKVTGKSGDTTAVMTFNMDGDTAAVQGDAYLTTSVSGVSVKAGQYEGGKSNMTAKSARDDKATLSYDFNGVALSYETVDAGAGVSNTETTAISADVAGVKVTYKKKDTSDEVHLSGSISGINIAYRGIDSDTADNDAAGIVVSGSFNGVDVTYAQADADTSRTLNGDGIHGDINSGEVTASTAATTTVAGTDLRTIKLSTSVAGNTVSWSNTDIDAILAANDGDVNTLTISRPLASGSTLSAEYRMKDMDASNNDTDTLEAKLSVKF